MSEVHEPVKNLTLWEDGGVIMIKTREPGGDPVEMNEDESLALMQALSSLIDKIRPDLPYEPGDTPFDGLMHFLCVDRGYCGSVKADGTPLHVTMFIPDEGPVTADQFVEWVFLADNMNPNVEPERWQRHKDAIRDAFVRFMGADVAEASRLRWC